MNPDPKSNNDLRLRLLSDRPSVTHEGQLASLHFCEEQYLMLSHATKHLMIEYKLSQPIHHQQVMKFVELVQAEIKSRYHISLYIRQVAFNRTNIVTMYTMIKRSPKPKRRLNATVPSSSGISSDSESVTIVSDSNGNREQHVISSNVKPIAFIASSSQPRQSGELEATPFNGTMHMTPIIRTSTSQQTEGQPTSVVQAEPVSPRTQQLADSAKIYHKIELSKNINQVATSPTFTKVRRYLAYFVNNKETILDEESYLDLKIHNDGLIGTDSEIRTAYFEALKQRGFSEFQINKDLQNLGYNMQAKKVKEINSYQQAFDQFYGSRVKTRTVPPILAPPGRIVMCLINSIY